jgi:DNA-binding MarR family transcriptional regulator
MPQAQTPPSPEALAQAMASLDTAHVQSLYESVCGLLRILTLGEQEFAPAGGALKYNGLDFQSIGYLADHPGAMAVELAQFLDVAPTTITSTLDRLERRGLIKRERPPENRRSVSLSLTPEGEAVRAEMLKYDHRNMSLMLAALTPSSPDRHSARLLWRP